MLINQAYIYFCTCSATGPHAIALEQVLAQQVSDVMARQCAIFQQNRVAMHRIGKVALQSPSRNMPLTLVLHFSEVRACF